MRKALPYLLAAALSLWAAAAWGQQRKDSVVTLVSSKSAQLIEERGQSFRKVIGPARFLHNKTYLLCDTALWNVTTNVIDAIGHVQIIQDRTRLTSNTLQYVVDESMAKFRGSLVQLEDKDKNTLRTRYLDYNTKDSVAVFQNGASMRDKDGQIIESLYGSYDSKARLFVFNDQVNMYMDTTFIKTSRLEYRSDINTAYFGYGTDMWQDDNMLSAHDGWYDRDKELFFFRRNVHLLTKDQETWSDTLYYHRARNDVELLGNVELMDTTRNAYALAGRVEYTDSVSRVKMTRRPAVMSISEEKGRKDTLYVGGDTLWYRGINRDKVPAAWVTDANKRLQELQGDPVTEYRRKAAEAAAKAAAEEAAKNAPGGVPKGEAKAPGGRPEGVAPTEGTLPAGNVPMPGEMPVPADTTAVADSTAAPVQLDSTRLSFIWAVNKVKLYRRDMQMSCDSLVYSDLDSLARLYRDPIVFNEGNRQYTSDSIYVVVRNRVAERARLMSNAFITTQEDTLCYDQIKGAEMMAYFDTTRTLQRFDALGGATALFFLTENGALATVNKVESKMLYALFDAGDLDRIYYFEGAKNDAYPVVQLPKDERYMKGFRWDPERKPRGRQDITPLVPRASQRTSYLARPHTKFKETDIYFPGHINKIYKDIAYRDSMAVVRSRQQKEAPKPVTPAVAPAEKDTAAVQEGAGKIPVPEVPPEALSAADDSLRVSLDSQRDSLSMTTDTLSFATDTLGVSADSLRLDGGQKPEVKPVEPDPKALAREAERARKAEERRLKEEERQRKADERARIEAEKQAERDAKWARLDSLDAQKKLLKEQKKLEKERKRKLRAFRRLEKKAQKERKIFERYLEKERAKAAKRAAREAEKARRKKEKNQTDI